jgi:hypothetical protein
MAGASNKAPAKISALVARGDCLRLPVRFCVMCRPDDRITLMLCTINVTKAHQFRRR